MIQDAALAGARSNAELRPVVVLIKDGLFNTLKDNQGEITADALAWYISPRGDVNSKRKNGDDPRPVQIQFDAVTIKAAREQFLKKENEKSILWDLPEATRLQKLRDNAAQKIAERNEAEKIVAIATGEGKLDQVSLEIQARAALDITQEDLTNAAIILTDRQQRLADLTAEQVRDLDLPMMISEQGRLAATSRADSFLKALAGEAQGLINEGDGLESENALVRAVDAFSGGKVDITLGKPLFPSAAFQKKAANDDMPDMGARKTLVDVLALSQAAPAGSPKLEPLAFHIKTTLMQQFLQDGRLTSGEIRDVIAKRTALLPENSVSADRLIAITLSEGAAEVYYQSVSGVEPLTAKGHEQDLKDIIAGAIASGTNAAGEHVVLKITPKGAFNLGHDNVDQSKAIKVILRNGLIVSALKDAGEIAYTGLTADQKAQIIEAVAEGVKSDIRPSKHEAWTKNSRFISNELLNGVKGENHPKARFVVNFTKETFKTLEALGISAEVLEEAIESKLHTDRPWLRTHRAPSRDNLLLGSRDEGDRKVAVGKTLKFGRLALGPVLNEDKASADPLAAGVSGPLLPPTSPLLPTEAAVRDAVDDKVDNTAPEEVQTPRGKGGLKAWRVVAGVGAAAAAVYAVDDFQFDGAGLSTISAMLAHEQRTAGVVESQSRVPDAVNPDTAIDSAVPAVTSGSALSGAIHQDVTVTLDAETEAAVISALQGHDGLDNFGKARQLADVAQLLAQDQTLLSGDPGARALLIRDVLDEAASTALIVGSKNNPETRGWSARILADAALFNMEAINLGAETDIELRREDLSYADRLLRKADELTPDFRLKAQIALRSQILNQISGGALGNQRVTFTFDPAN